MTVNCRELPPVVCNGYLKAFEKNNAGSVVKKISIEDGKTVAIKSVSEAPEQMCDVTF